MYTINPTLRSSVQCLLQLVGLNLFLIAVLLLEQLFEHLFLIFILRLFNAVVMATSLIKLFIKQAQTANR